MELNRGPQAQKRCRRSRALVKARGDYLSEGDVFFINNDVK